MGGKNSKSDDNTSPTSKNILRSTCNTIVLDDESCSFTEKADALNSAATSTISYVQENKEAVNDECYVCSNIIFGTSNHNFLKYRHLKKVS